MRFTALARDNGKWNELHSKVGPRDMLTSLKTKRERGRGTVLDAEMEKINKLRDATSIAKTHVWVSNQVID